MVEWAVENPASLKHNNSKMSPMQLLLGIKRSTPLIQAVLKNLSRGLGPVCNRQLDRRQVAVILGSEAFNVENANSNRRYSMKISVDDLIVMHCDSDILENKLGFEFLGPY